MAPAGALLSALWQAQPSLASDFVSQQHLPDLLKLAAHMIGSTARHRLVVLRLVRQVWSFTESLESEPLLVQAVPDIVQCCRRAVETIHLTAKELQLQAHIQVTFHISNPPHSTSHGLCYNCVSLLMRPLMSPLHSPSAALCTALAPDVTTAMRSLSITAA